MSCKKKDHTWNVSTLLILDQSESTTNEREKRKKEGLYLLQRGLQQPPGMFSTDKGRLVT